MIEALSEEKKAFRKTPQELAKVQKTDLDKHAI